MTHGLDNLRAPDVAWVLRGRLASRHRPLPWSQVRPLRHPACPRPGSSSRAESARDASRSRCRRCVKHRVASPCPRHSRLCYSSAVQRLSLPSHGKAEQSLRVSSQSVLSPRHRRASLGIAKHFRRSAALCRSVASRASLRCAFPLRRVLCDASPLPRAVARCFAAAAHCISEPSPRYAPQSIAFAARISPSPLHAAALLRRRLALLCSAVPWPFSSPHGRATQCLCVAPRCRSFAGPFAALLRHCRAWLCFACPFHRYSRISHAFPSPLHALLRKSFATPTFAKPLRCCSEQIKALPLQRPSPQLHRRATRCCASPSRCRARQILRHSFLRHTAIAVPSLRLASQLRCMAVPGRARPSRHGASLGSSVAHHRNAPLSRRYSGSEPSAHSKRPLPLLRHWPMPRNWP